MGLQCGVTKGGSVPKLVVRSLAPVKGEYANTAEISEGKLVFVVRAGLMAGWLWLALGFEGERRGSAVSGFSSSCFLVIFVLHLDFMLG